jgi:hypothetical protein
MTNEDMDMDTCIAIIDQRTNELLQPKIEEVEDIEILEPMEYAFSMNGTITNCPVFGCPLNTDKRPVMRRHFRNMHHNATPIIEEEGRLPQCTNCGLFQSQVGDKHKATASCREFTQVKVNRELQRIRRNTRV